MSFESSLISSFTLRKWFRFLDPWCPFVWLMTCFISRMEKSLSKQSIFIYFFSISSWCLFSILEFWLFILSLLDFISRHGVIFNAIHLSVMLPFCGSIVESFLWKILVWRQVEPQDSILDLIYLSHFKGFKQDLNVWLENITLGSLVLEDEVAF